MTEQPEMPPARREEIITLLQGAPSPDTNHPNLYEAAQVYVNEGAGGRKSVLDSGMASITRFEQEQGAMGAEEVVGMFTRGVEGIKQSAADYARTIRHAELLRGGR